MVLNVSDNASHRRDQIDNLTDLLVNAPTRQALVRAVNFGKKRAKSVGELAKKLSAEIGKKITPKRVTEIGKPLVNRAFTQERILDEDGRKTTAYAKFDHHHDVKEALKLANNKKKREAYHTKSRPKVKVIGHTVTIKVPFKPRVKTLYVDDIKEFQKVKSVKSIPPTMSPPRLPEAVVKKGIVKLLGEQLDPKDWGGEPNDLFARVTINGKRKRAAFALKGPATKGPLVPGKMGKNGDQIQRLFASPAQIFFVQYEEEIKESVIDLMGRLATAKAITDGEVYYGVIDLTDTYRLRLAYPKAFTRK